VSARRLPPDLAARMLDQIVLDRVRTVDDALALPELEEDLIGLIEEVRRPEDPPAKAIAVHLILAAIDTCDATLAETARLIQRGQAVAS